MPHSKPARRAPTPAPVPSPPSRKLPVPEDDNVVREQQSKSKVRPDGPGDQTSPVSPTKRSTRR
ncbi:MAG: hypothetical protein H0V17_00860 [Deltaproteobacteria bacterium]|nr:hypothetical protein [Deltaproteobacteria bacterium]